MTHSPGAQPDYWSVLGLEPGADAPSLKAAFRAQARRWHPDLNGNDPLAEERFKRVNEAYAVLSDPRRRQAWEAGGPSAGQGGSGAGDPFATGFPDFDDYLDALLGERRRPVQEQGPPVEREYAAEEMEFMQALDRYKRTSGRMFPTCSETLEVLKSLGYRRDAAQE